MQMNPAAIQRAIYLGTAVCAVLATWWAAQLTWLFLTPQSDVASAVPAPAVSTQPVTSNSVNINQLKALNLFGEAQQGTQQAANAPKTQLNLRLVGVSASSDPMRSAAIIQQGNAQQTYIIGDSLQGARVTIEEIYADRVILNNAGRLETLELEGIGELSDGLSLTLANSTQDSTQSSAPADATTIDNRDNEELAERLAQIRQNPQSIMQFVNIEPVVQNGELQGYRLSPAQNPELFRASGLQTGDLAVAINGYDLTDFSAAMAATQELETSTEATIAVVRDGQYVELRFGVDAAAVQE